MQLEPEKRVLPTQAGVEVAPVAPAEVVERAVTVEANSAIPIEAVGQSAAGVETVDGVRAQLAQGSDALGTEKARGSGETSAIVILFPDAQERQGFEGQATERKVFTLLHIRSAIANPGAVIRLLQELPKAA